MKMKKLIFMMTLILGASLVPEIKADSAVYNGWEKSNGYWYYYENGNMKTGWQKDGGTWYYMSSNGIMSTGWVKDGGSWYYLYESGAMATGWVKDGGKWYYLDGSGAMKTGWIKDAGTWYYLDSTGAMATGWIDDGGERYYLNDDDGSMATGWGKNWAYGYYFNADGTLASDITVDGYYIDSDGMWNSSYLGEVKVEAKKSSYYINQTKSIDFTITNYTREKVQYKINYTVRKEVDFVWKDVALKDTSVSDTVYELNPGERKEFSISLSNIDEKLTADTYEIKMKIGDQYEYGYFDLSNDNIIVLRTEDNGAVKEGAKKLQFTITNNSDKELTYGKDYRIEKFVYPEWVEVPLKDDSFTEETAVVKPHETNMETIELDNLSEFNEYNEYRIVKEIDGNEYSDIFLDERGINHVVEN